MTWEESGEARLGTVLVREAEAMRTPSLRQKQPHTCGYVSLREHVFHWHALSQFEPEAVAVTQSQRRADLYTQSCVCSSKGILCRNITLAAKKKRESGLKQHLDYSCYETGSQLCSNICTFTAKKQQPQQPENKEHRDSALQQHRYFGRWKTGIQFYSNKINFVATIYSCNQFINTPL